MPEKYIQFISPSLWVLSNSYQLINFTHSVWSIHILFKLQMKQSFTKISDMMTFESFDVWWRYLSQRQKQWQTVALCNDNSNNKMEICIVQTNTSLDVLVQPRIQDIIGYSKHKRWTKLGSSSNQHWLISMSNSVPCPVGWLQCSSIINALLDKYVVNKYHTPQYRCINKDR